MVADSPERSADDYRVEIRRAWDNFRQVRDKYGGAGLTTYVGSRTEHILKIADERLREGEKPNDDALAQASQELAHAAMDPLQYIGTRIDQAVLASRRMESSQVSTVPGGHFKSEGHYEFKSDVGVVGAAQAEYHRCRQIQFDLMRQMSEREARRLAALPTQNPRIMGFLITQEGYRVDMVDPRRESPFTNPFMDANRTEYGYPARQATATLRRLAGIQDEGSLLMAFGSEARDTRSRMKEATKSWEQAGKPTSGDLYNQYYLAAQAVREVATLEKTIVNPASHVDPRPVRRLN